MPHFFIKSENVKNGIAKVCDEENYKHIAKSLRARTGEKLLLIDENQIQYETIIEQITSKEISAKIEKSYKSERNLDFELYLAQSPLRSDDQSELIEKSTELGVKAVYPALSDNCALNKSVVEKKISKWQKIMYEASKQCERAIVPTCEEAVEKFDDLILNNTKFDKIIAFCERRTKITLREYCEKSPFKKDEKILVIIGPEGGFSDREFRLFEEKSIPMLTLGELILKADTAATVALGNIIYEYSNYCKN